MFIVHVRPEFVEAFEKASLDNACHSIKEPGIVRFDVIRQVDDRTRFVLVEVYGPEKDTAGRKETARYKRWRDAVEKMTVEPRYGVGYSNVFPDENGWG